jgi:hypothetical protein
LSQYIEKATISTAQKLSIKGSFWCFIGWAQIAELEHLFGRCSSPDQELNFEMRHVKITNDNNNTSIYMNIEHSISTRKFQITIVYFCNGAFAELVTRFLLAVVSLLARLLDRTF